MNPRRNRPPLSPEASLAYALRLLNQREYSRKGLKQKIITRGGLPDEADAIVAKCVELKLVDDVRLAKTIIKNESQWRRQSQRAIGAKLIHKGIPKTVIEAHLPATRESEALRALYHGGRWVKKNQELSIREKQVKLMAFLYRKGFSGESIRSAAKQLIE